MEKAIRFLSEVDDAKSYHLIIKDWVDDMPEKIHVNTIGKHALKSARKAVKDWAAINKTSCLAGINAHVRWVSYVPERSMYQICIDIDVYCAHYMQFITLYVRA